MAIALGALSVAFIGLLIQGRRDREAAVRASSVQASLVYCWVELEPSPLSEGYASEVLVAWNHSNQIITNVEANPGADRPRVQWESINAGEKVYKAVGGRPLSANEIGQSPPRRQECEIEFDAVGGKRWKRIRGGRIQYRLPTPTVDGQVWSEPIEPVVTSYEEERALPPRSITRRNIISGSIGIFALVTAIVLSRLPSSQGLPYTTSQRWAYTTGGSVFSSPVVAGGTVYVGSDDNVYALDAATGQVRWTYTTERAVFSSLAVASGTVYVASLDNVYALDAATGQVHWTYRTGGFVFSSLAVASGTVYVGSDDNVYALDAATGQVRWTYTTEGAVFSSLAVASGTVYVASDDNHKVYALDAATGQVRWTYTSQGAGFSSPAVAGGAVYVGSDDNVYALDAATGRVRWTYTSQGAGFSSPAVAGGAVYVGSLDDVYALDAATGRVRWTYTSQGAGFSSPAVAGGAVYVGSLNYTVYALKAAWS
jgi:outer membrane protein assembly factor BamB